MKPSQCQLKIKDYFDSIKPYNYFVAKFKSPYNPPNFPDSYPVGRDVDIVCSDDDFNKIADLTFAFFKRDKVFSKRIINDNPYHIRFRYEVSDYFERPKPMPHDKLINGKSMTKLHFQFDICATAGENFNWISPTFISRSLERKKSINNIYVPEETDETALRVFYFKKSPDSFHHLDFIKSKSGHFLCDDLSKEFQDFYKGLGA